jgi:hypothetical protein
MRSASRLHGQQSERQVDRLLSERLTEGIACVEMPVFLSPDDDPTFYEPSTKWRDRIDGERNGKRR